MSVPVFIPSRRCDALKIFSTLSTVKTFFLLLLSVHLFHISACLFVILWKNWTACTNTDLGQACQCLNPVQVSPLWNQVQRLRLMMIPNPRSAKLAAPATSWGTHRNKCISSEKESVCATVFKTYYMQAALAVWLRCRSNWKTDRWGRKLTTAAQAWENYGPGAIYGP